MQETITLSVDQISLIKIGLSRLMEHYEEGYNKYPNDTTFKNAYVNCRDVLVDIHRQCKAK